MTGASLERRLKAEAYAAGFDLAGIATLGPAESAAVYEAWVAEGYHGEMGYMVRNADVRADTTRPHPGARSALVVAMDYGGKEPAGPVARYARGDDYHDVVRDRLERVHAWLSEHLGRPVHARAYVDTAPILERDLAQRAGLGWVGKNTNLINPKLGSFIFLGALFTELELEPDAPFEADRCGTCRRCLDACPTDAFAGPRVLDARQCISYLTIELRGAIPEELRSGVGEHLYGCDVCQDVCPWNVRFARALPDDSPYAPREVLAGKDARTLAREMLATTREEFGRAFGGSPMKRAKLRGLKRNAAVALGNVGTVEDVRVLEQALNDEERLVREHAAWALRRLDRDRDAPPPRSDEGDSEPRQAPAARR